jgi:nucleotide-binding universal stress UspA family protein
MINLLVYTDGKAHSLSALRFAATLTKRLNARLAVITVRSGTHGGEEPPPVGIELGRDQLLTLSRGLQILVSAMETLAAENVFTLPAAITVRDTPEGYMFVCKTPDGDRVPFYEAFGHFLEVLNKVVDRQSHDLLIISPDRRKGISRFVVGDTTRKLVLGLNASLLVVRNAGPDSRFLICADGAASSRRLFPLVQKVLPAIVPPVDIVSVERPGISAEQILATQDCLEKAQAWLNTCGKMGSVLHRKGESRAPLIAEAAGSGSVIVMGASLRHDVMRRMLGSLPMQVLDLTESSLLLAKLPPETADAESNPLSHCP